MDPGQWQGSHMGKLPYWMWGLYEGATAKSCLSKKTFFPVVLSGVTGGWMDWMEHCVWGLGWTGDVTCVTCVTLEGQRR